MKLNLTRRVAVAALMAASVTTSLPAFADGHSKVQLRMATSGSETDQRSVAMQQRIRTAWWVHSPVSSQATTVRSLHKAQS